MKMLQCGLLFWLFMLISFPSFAQSAKKIPIYPGATLVVDKTATDEPCCNFFTKDAFDKVIAFYQTQLNTKPLEPKEIAAKYPALKANIQQLEKQLPATMKFRAFILSEVTMGGQKGAEMFEVTGSPVGVNFNVANFSLVKNDEHFTNLGVSRWESLQKLKQMQKS